MEIRLMMLQGKFFDFDTLLFMSKLVVLLESS